MILLAHILIALTSLIVTAATFVSPSHTMLKFSWVFVALTIASGTLVAVSSPVHMIHACVSGLIYTGVVFTAIVAIRRKLVTSRG